MYHQRKVIKNKCLWDLVNKQAGYKEGKTNPLTDIVTAAELYSSQIFYETFFVRKGKKEEDFQGIDTFVKLDPELSEFTVQVKCTRVPHLNLEDWSGPTHHCCWDHCDADKVLWVYASTVPGEVIISEYLTSEIKECLKQVRYKRTKFTGRFYSNLGFGNAYYIETPNSGYFQFWRGDDPRDR